MAKIVWTRKASDCLRQIHGYLSQKSPAAADSVVGGIHRKIRQLKQQTRLGHLLETSSTEEVRELLYGHYRIVYRIRTEDRIELIGIFHAAMDLSRYFL